MREVTRVAEVTVRAMEVTGGAAVATSAAATTPAEPPKKRKRGFSTLR
jgi:acetaldehyde dehydrogenase (acetylating)